MSGSGSAMSTHLTEYVARFACLASRWALGCPLIASIWSLPSLSR